jgi:NADP oxidoreductase coenzyme F420-dependent
VSASPSVGKHGSCRGGQGTAVAIANRDALQRADAVVLAVPFRVLKGVTDEIAESLTGKFLVVPSHPVGLDARGKVARLPPKGQSFRKWYRRGLDRRLRSGQCRPIRFESFGDPSPERAVLVEVIDDGRAGEDVERSIRPAGFERMKVTGSKGRVESRPAATSTMSSSAPRVRLALELADLAVVNGVYAVPAEARDSTRGFTGATNTVTRDRWRSHDIDRNIHA